MTKTYGVKDNDVAAAHIVDQVLSGALRSGDRVDRNVVAAILGMSRVPVAEAIVQLERDGILRSEYYRGAFVEQFDADVVNEHYEVYGELSGLASARAAKDPTPRLLKELKEHLAVMEAAEVSADFENTLWEFRRAINDEYAGPRLRAAIGTFQTFLPRAFWLSYAGDQASMLPFYRDEYAAIRGRDPDAARWACCGRSATMASIVIAELVSRGVLSEDTTDGQGGISEQESGPRRRTRRVAG